MNRKLIVGIVIAVVVIGGGAAAWFTLKKADEEPQASSVQPEQVTQDDSDTTLNKLMKSGKNATCTFTFKDDEGNNSSGVVYIASDQRMRSDIVANSVSQPQQEASVISTKDVQYMWSSNSKQGVKSTLKPDQTQSNESDQDQSIDKDKNYNYKCSDWKVDDSKFNPPADVTFTDVDAQMQQSQQQGQTTDPAAACAQIPDANARVQCEKATQQ